MTNKLAKIAVSGEADEALVRMIGVVNDGFKGGRIGKQEIASWAIKAFEARLFQGCIDDIRRDYFDEVAYLQAITKDLRAAKKSGADPAMVRTMLAPLIPKGPIKPRRPRAPKPADADAEPKPSPRG